MAETIIWPLAKTTLRNLASFSSKIVWERIKAVYHVEDDICFIEETLIAISAVLQDAGAKQYANQAIEIWLADLKSVAYELDDLCDQVAYDNLLRENKHDNFAENVRYYCSSSSSPLQIEQKWASEIKALRVNLESIVAKKSNWGLTENAVEAPAVQKDLFDNCSYVNKSDILGRDNAKKEVLERLLVSHNTAKCPYILPIVGIGGIGKTALAKLVYADLPFKKEVDADLVDGGQFNVKMWASVSHKFDVIKLLEDLIQDATGEDKSNLAQIKLVEEFRKLIEDKKYFIVLDDVWFEDRVQWMELKSIFEGGKVGSVILITTRKLKTADIFDTNEPYYTLDRLPDDVCESIFNKFAFREKTEYPVALRKLGNKIVHNCSGNPLVVKSLGGLLYDVSNQKEWERIADDVERIINLSIDKDKKVLKILKLSYDKLPPHLKICFIYCALLVKGAALFPSYLSSMWSAHRVLAPQGGNSDIEEGGHTVVMELVSRGVLEQETSEFNDTTYDCKLHDLMHDVGAEILGEELAVVTCDQVKVSKLTKHIIWGYESSSSWSDKDFPEDLRTADKARTFIFGYKMNYVKETFLDGILSSFKLLRFLQFSSSKFEELPESIKDLIHLRVLMLSNNPDLKSLPDSICYLLNLERLHFRYCGKLEKLPEKIGQLVNLRNLAMTTCSQTSLANTTFNRLRSLRHLWIVACKLNSLWSDDDVRDLTSIRRLCIEDCKFLTKLPKNMKQLEELEIKNCQALNLEENECLSDCKRLQTLLIEGLPQLTRLPNGIQSAATSLKYLRIKDCANLNQLVPTLENFVALRKILIHNCPSMMVLPQGFQRLRDLQKLDFDGCPHLSERYAVTSGEDYPVEKRQRVQ